MLQLPIDPLLSEIVASLRATPSLVLEAPPGAGKTTRVPRALLDAGMEGEIVVLEPRRLAARMAARRVADELGERLGERVGYRVRYEDVGSAQTRIRFVTEGTLTRQLLSDPTLRGVSAVLLDEFHERHLQTDVALALLTNLQRTARPDLRLVVMSATLGGDRVGAYLGASVLRSEGRRFSVELEHLDKPDDRPIGQQVASALRRLLQLGLDGHVLVFLPGAREIRRAMEACTSIAEREGLELLPLHGDLSSEEQDAVLAPSSRRKVILSTNVAESSVTIDGVAAVIDSGLARQLSHSPWTGLSALRTEKISRASATQRAGRAGRTREGRCLRLYTRHDFEARPEHDTAELLRADLSEVTLELRSHGLDPASFNWFEAPASAALGAASTLLNRLGALDERGEITALGRAMLRYPLHPRLARLVIEADRAGLGPEGCGLAALLSEKDIRLQERASFRDRHGGAGQRESTDSDVLARFEELERSRDERLSAGQLRTLGLDVAAVFGAQRAWKQLERRLPRSSPRPPDDRDEALRRALLAAFSDRVARRRRAGGRDFVLSGGGTATAGDGTQVHEAPYVIVVATTDTDDKQSRAAPIARVLSGIEPEWLLELFPERIKDARETSWNADSERVEVVERLLYDELAIDETRGAKGDEREVAAALAEAALKRGLPAFVNPPDALERFVARARFLGELLSGFPRFDDEGLAAKMRALCEGRRSFKELREADLLAELEASLSQDERRKLTSWAPERIELRSGRKAPVSYEPGKPPHVESRLQDFFGMKETPKVAEGRVALVVHLLAPSGRPVQITADLAGFWARTYPQVRKELCRKYPRHNWPEDPTVPQPTMASGGRR